MESHELPYDNKQYLLPLNIFNLTFNKFLILTTNTIRVDITNAPSYLEFVVGNNLVFFNSNNVEILKGIIINEDKINRNIIVLVEVWDETITYAKYARVWTLFQESIDFIQPLDNYLQYASSPDPSILDISINVNTPHSAGLIGWTLSYKNNDNFIEVLKGNDLLTNGRIYVEFNDYSFKQGTYLIKATRYDNLMFPIKSDSRIIPIFQTSKFIIVSEYSQYASLNL